MIGELRLDHRLAYDAQRGTHRTTRRNHRLRANLRSGNGRLETMLEPFAKRAAALQHAARKRDGKRCAFVAE